jgi:hypothetical protein
MVVRVPPELPERLTMISQHLFEETRIEYSYAAIVRGLIALGLTQVEGAPNLSVLFIGARIPRGRKPGGKIATAVVPLDLTQEDMDLEFEDQHHDDRLPKPKNEVVARQRVRRRRSPLRDAALLEPKPLKDEEEDDEPTDPGLGIDDEDTVDESDDDDTWDRPEASAAREAARAKEAEILVPRPLRPRMKALVRAAKRAEAKEKKDAAEALKAAEAKPPPDKPTK